MRQIALLWFRNYRVLSSMRKTSTMLHKSKYPMNLNIRSHVEYSSPMSCKGFVVELSFQVHLILGHHISGWNRQNPGFCRDQRRHHQSLVKCTSSWGHVS
ncbi:hypothetical protein RchiOBHm_Chr4g0400861 [Rosa chinensis]|uniref:Uncharacterized protein n=1 Tax=Rosa chinensis TaxID=74649 RepID=A0A2P6QSX6_ROSCH|nr:hypothetical protein RchiOBHm_Chr4g0400861 [Rosa chinensis]